MIEAFAARLIRNRMNGRGQGARHGAGGIKDILLRKACLDRKLLPLPRTDVFDEICAADPVGELQLARIEIVDQRAGNVIEGGETGSDRKSVV